MFSLLRFAPKPAPSLLQRSFQPASRQYARVAEPQAIEDEGSVLAIAPPGGIATLPSTDQSRRSLVKYNVEVKPDHGLYAFFRKEEDEDGKVTYHTVEPPEGDALFPSGRAWKAAELRLKSFQDLHTLWYIVLRERNLLASQREEARRIGIQNPSAWNSSKKAGLCRKTMARIKYVLNERRLAYEGAVKLVEAEAAEKEALKEDEKVLKYQLQEWRKGRALRRAARSKRKQPTEEEAPSVFQSTTEEAQVVDEEVQVTAPSEPAPVEEASAKDTPPEPVNLTTEDAPSSSSSSAPPPEEAIASTNVFVEQAAEKPRTRSERRAERKKKEIEDTLAAKEAPEGVDAAESSLFGGPPPEVKKKS